MQASTSLLDWILSLLRDPDARAAFQDDPDHYAARYGFQDLSAADVHDALCLIADNGSASYDHTFSEANDVHYPPPHYYHGGEDAPRYLDHYITNNYRLIDSHDTYLDNSVHQDVDTHGGDFRQVIDNDPVTASGDHSVAAGGHIRNVTLTSGDDDVVGDHDYAVTGDRGTTAFGSGDATDADFGHARFGDGGALSIDGDAEGHSVDDDTTTRVHSSGSGETAVNAAGEHGYGTQFADQHESDDSEHQSYEDDSRADSHDELDSHNDSRFDDRNDTDVHHG